MLALGLALQSCALLPQAEAPAPPPTTKPAGIIAPEQEATGPVDIKAAQRALLELGYYQAGVDGIVGPQTEAALIRATGTRPPGCGPVVGCPPHKARVRLHVKVLQQPDIPISTMISNMQAVYGPAGFLVEVASTETLNAPSLLDLDLGPPATACGSISATSTEHTQLFQNRNNVGTNEVVVYFVRSTSPPLNGCASHPAGRPGAVVVQTASQWTLGHEVGHVLGLNHVNNNDRLMTGNGTFNITNPPPDLISTEVTTMDNSSLTINC